MKCDQKTAKYTAHARAAYLLLSDLGYDEHRWEEPPTALKNLSNAIVVEPDVGKVLKILQGG